MLLLLLLPVPLLLLQKVAKKTGNKNSGKMFAVDKLQVRNNKVGSQHSHPKKS